MSYLLAGLADLQFLRPLWLAGLLVLPVLAWWWHVQAPRRGVWQDAVDAHLLPHLLEAADGARQRPWARWSGLLAAALALVALAGPSVRKVELPLWQSKAPLVVVLDLSSATLARDLPPSRLAQARAKIATLLRERAGGQVALVAFAEDAYTVAPLTEDAANIALFLDALAPDVMPEDGHRADRAIAWSQRLLRNAGFDHGDILLLSDRADDEAIAEAARARAAGYRVSALGLGTARGGVFETPTGLRNARLDAGSLQSLEASGGGAYRALAPGDADLRALGVLDPRVADGASARGEKIASRRDDGYWLLPLAMLLALPLFRRGRATVAMLALALCLPMPPAQAQDADGWWRRADQQAHARMLEGVAAYRRQQYKEAIGKFTGNPTAVGQYNLGNALAKAGRYDDAIAAYDRALKQQPGMGDATENRRIVMKAKQQQESQPNKPGDKPGNKSGREPRPCKPGDKDCYEKSNNPDDPRGQFPDDSRPLSAQATQPKSSDLQKQQQADAAQRQRMQDALRKQQQAQQTAQGQPQPPRQETAEQRERRIANQAQLQRVPDDPGALLRAKFRLEYERRQGLRQ